MEVLIPKRIQLSLILALTVTFCAGQVLADEIRIAVASNFAEAIKEIAERFEAKTGHEVILAYGSTGKHYAQIKNGAPFEAFFAADVERPKLLEDEGRALSGSRFTYAVGKLVLWSPKPDVVDANGSVLNTGDFRFIAIANPKLAPYGKAAKEILQARGVWDQLQKRIVRGENINQAFQFAHSGNAELGFVAFSKVKRPNRAVPGSFWQPPQSLYSAIDQQAVLLKSNATARAFMAFVQGEEACTIIQSYGYGTL